MEDYDIHKIVNLILKGRSFQNYQAHMKCWTFTDYMIVYKRECIVNFMIDCVKCLKITNVGFKKLIKILDNINILDVIKEDTGGHVLQYVIDDFEYSLKKFKKDYKSYDELVNMLTVKNIL